MSPRTLPRSVRVTSAFVVLAVGGSLAMQAFGMSTVPALITAASVVFCTVVFAAILMSPDLQANFTRRRLEAQARAGYSQMRQMLRANDDETAERVVSSDEVEQLLADTRRPEIDETIISPRTPMSVPQHQRRIA